MNLIPVLYFLLLIAAMQKCRTNGNFHNQTEPEDVNQSGRMVVYSVNRLSKHDNESINGNYIRGGEKTNSGEHKFKTNSYQDHNYNSSDSLHDNARNVSNGDNSKFSHSELNTSLNGEGVNDNFTSDLRFMKGTSDVNYTHTEDKGTNEKNSSYEFEKNFNDTLHDDGSVFDSRRREDTYVITAPEKFPYSVLLFLAKGKDSATCTGSIITKEWVLTASHCVYGIESVIVYAGGNSRQEYVDYTKKIKPLPATAQLLRGAQLIKHPLYTNDKHDCDVGLIKVEGKFNMTKAVNVIQLSTTTWGESYHSYTKCNMTGFGVVQIGQKRQDDVHRKTHILDVKNPCLCSFRLQILFGTKTAKRYICTKPQLDHGVCSGDSGGGLVCEGKLRAVTMQLVQLRETEFCDITVLGKMECGAINSLSVFEDICPFLPWVNSYVKLFNASEITPKCRYMDSSSHVKVPKLLFIFSNLAIVLIKFVTL